MGGEKGKGIVATAGAPAGHTLMEDAPFASMQHESNSSTVQHCLQCHKPLGAAPAAAAHASGAAGEACDRGATPCPGECGEQFCSAKCCTVALASHHRMLCRSRCRGDLSHPLAEFYEHALASNEIFSLAARVIARIVAAFQAGASFNDAVRPFALLHKRMWWEVAVRGEDMTREQLAEEEGPYKYLAAATATLLCRALCGADPRRPAEGELRKDRSTDRALEAAEAAGAVERGTGDDGAAVCVDVIALQSAAETAAEGVGAIGPEPPAPGLEYLPCFQPGFLALLVGAFELNNISIEFPVQSTAEEGEKEEKEPAADGARDDGKGEEEEEERSGEEGEEEFEGTGVFPLLACLNHSCTPNTAVHFPHRSATAAAVALRDIEAGEELTISYVDEDADYASRQEDLADYGFECRCPKCESERADA